MDFHLCLFQAISGLVEDVVLTMDSTRLMDGKAESRNTKEGVMSQDMQALLLLLLPENPAAPALRTGARGLLRFAQNCKFAHPARISLQPKCLLNHISMCMRPLGRIDNVALKRWALFTVE